MVEIIYTPFVTVNFNVGISVNPMLLYCVYTVLMLFNVLQSNFTNDRYAKICPGLYFPHFEKLILKVDNKCPPLLNTCLVRGCRFTNYSAETAVYVRVSVIWGMFLQRVGKSSVQIFKSFNITPEAKPMKH